MSITRSEIEVFFRGMESTLRLRVRAKRPGNPIADEPADFKADELARALIKSGVPTEEIFDILTQIEGALLEEALFDTDIHRVDLVRVVGQVLQSQGHQDRLEWSEAYHNRYGWLFEVDALPSVLGRGEYVRTTDFEAIDAVVDAIAKDVRERHEGKTDKEHAADVNAIKRHTTRAVRATRLHTVSRRLVRRIAKEIANWTLTAPEWTREQRKERLEQAKRSLADAMQTGAIGDLLVTAKHLGRALTIGLLVLQQRYGLWVGVLDDNPRRMLERFITLLDRAQKHHDQRERSRAKRVGAQGKVPYGTDLFERLAEFGLKPDEFMLHHKRILKALRSIHKEREDTPERRNRQSERLKEASNYLGMLLNWIEQLVSKARPSPTVDDYSSASSLYDRQRTLGAIVKSLIEGAGFIASERANSFIVDIPQDCPTLRAFGGTGSMVFVCIARTPPRSKLESEDAVSRSVVESRLRGLSADERVVVVFSPHGFTAEAKEIAFEQSRRNEIILMFGAEALRALTVPADFRRVLEATAADVMANSPFPACTPASLVRNFETARRFAAELHHAAALNALVTEFERSLRNTMHAWLLTTWGPRWSAKVNSTYRSQLVLFDCLRLLTAEEFQPFRDACGTRVRDVTGVAVDEAHLFPPAMVSLLPDMKKVRNVSAHGAKKLYPDDYREFREMYERFVRLLVRLDYWPRLLIHKPTHVNQGLHPLFDPDGGTEVARVPREMIPERAEEVYLFARGWLGKEPEPLWCEAVTLRCEACSHLVSAEEWGAGDQCRDCSGPQEAEPTKAINVRHKKQEERSVELKNPKDFRDLLEWLAVNVVADDEIAALFPLRSGDATRMTEPGDSLPPESGASTARARWKKLLRRAFSGGRQLEIVTRALETRGQDATLRDLQSRFTAMTLFSHQDILLLHAAALTADLARHRDSLLVGIAPAICSNIQRDASDSQQLLLDLGALNQLADLRNNVVPLSIWLNNAIRFSFGRQEELSTFERYLAKLAERQGKPGDAERDDHGSKRSGRDQLDRNRKVKKSDHEERESARKTPDSRRKAQKK